MCEISLSKDGDLQLTIPSDTGGSHHITVPITEDGLRIIKKVLRERQREERATIGMTSSPTQAQVNAWLRAERAERAAVAAKTQIVPGLSLSDLHLDL